MFRWGSRRRNTSRVHLKLVPPTLRPEHPPIQRSNAIGLNNSLRNSECRIQVTGAAEANFELLSALDTAFQRSFISREESFLERRQILLKISVKTPPAAGLS